VSWRRLDELAAREHEVVEDGEWEALPPLQEERARLFETLPAPLPQEALPTLERALAQAQQTEAALRENLEAAGRVLAGIRRGRRAATAYGGPSTSRALDARG
jgi:Flagellar protein FliT